MNFILNTMPEKAVPSKRPVTTDLLAYGGYMVNAAGCSECHTKSEKGKVVGEPFAGGFEFRSPDGSVLRSANITLIMKMALEVGRKYPLSIDLKAMPTVVINPGKLPPAPCKPLCHGLCMQVWTAWNLKAIYTYLKTVTPVKKPVVKWNPATLASNL
jgi:hypothetical protein